MRNLLRDVRFGVRLLARNPGFTAIAVLTLGLGIGANTAIFSVVYGTLIEPLPYRDPGRLVLVWQELRARGVTEFPFPPGDIPDLREKGTLLADVSLPRRGELPKTELVLSLLRDAIGARARPRKRARTPA